MRNETPPLTVAEASETRAIPRRTIQDAINRGDLHAIKLPGLTGAYLLDRGQFNAWADRRADSEEKTA